MRDVGVGLVHVDHNGELLLTSAKREVSTSRLRRIPANALLNYLYTLLEAETTLALHAAGLDPGIGIWHRDERGRDSLTLDIMEAARPTVDAHILQLLTTGRFRRSDFHETRRGTCRI